MSKVKVTWMSVFDQQLTSGSVKGLYPEQLQYYAKKSGLIVDGAGVSAICAENAAQQGAFISELRANGFDVYEERIEVLGYIGDAPDIRVSRVQR